VRVVYDGPTAVAMVDEFKPDLVFLDIGMPGVDGYETARILRGAVHEHPFLLVALTGWGKSDDLRRTQEAGFDEHLTKPASLSAIENLLRRAASS
jgi:CheY-like chemotaxis protein